MLILTNRGKSEIASSPYINKGESCDVIKAGANRLEGTLGRMSTQSGAQSLSYHRKELGE